MNPNAQCQAIIQHAIAAKKAIGPHGHVTVYDEEIDGDHQGAVFRVAEAFSSWNASSNAPVEQRRDRTFVKVRYVPGGQATLPNGDHRDSKDVASMVAFQNLLDKLVAKYGNI